MERADTKINELSDQIAGQFDELSPQLRKAARYMLDHPDDVALRSMRQIAVQAGLPAATFVRLARALGYNEYQELRALFEDRMRSRSTSKTGYVPKARDLQLRSQGDGTPELIRDLFEADIRNLEKTFHSNDSNAFLRAAKLIESARQVFIIGQRSCYSVAFYFNYVYRFAHSNSVLLHNDGGVFGDELRDIGRGDVLVPISMAPYSRSVVDAAAFSRECGAKVLAITDDRLSVLGRLANESLLVSSQTPSFFHSLVSLISVTQALLALLVARGGKDAMKAIQRSERQIERFNPYWVDQTKKRSET